MTSVRMLVALCCMTIVISETKAYAFQAPVPGVYYLIPPGFQGYNIGTLITYGGYNYVVQANGTMLLAADQRTNPFSPGPSVNPSVIDQSNVQFRVNPLTGQLEVDRNRININQSAFDPQRNQEIPGTRRWVDYFNPDGSRTTGWTWYSVDGKPRSDTTTIRPNGMGGIDSSRQIYSANPSNTGLKNPQSQVLPNRTNPAVNPGSGPRLY